jgi:hypothetical protein
LGVLGQVVVVGSGLLLQAPAQLLIFEAVVTVFLAYAISGLAITTGALWPDFRADTAARAASSPAAVFFMVVALFLVFVVLTLQAGGLWLWLKGASGWAAAPAAAGAAICVAVGRWPVRRAAETLWARGL